MAFDGEVFRRSCLRACFGELGDKTFLLTVAFSIWCAWAGIRDNDDCIKARCLVFASTLIALGVRIILLTSLVDPFFAEAMFAYAGGAMMAVLALAAYVEMGRVEASEMKMGLLGSVGEASGRDMFKETEAHDVPEEGWNQIAFSGSSPLEGGSATPRVPDVPEKENYGSMGLQGSSMGPLFRGNAALSDRLASLIISFILPLVTIFVLEAEDKSESAVFLGGRSDSTDVAMGAVVGLVPVVLFAIVLGYVIERRLTDQWAAFLVLSILSSLALVELSQGLMHMAYVQPPEGALAVRIATPLQLSLLGVATESFRAR